MLQYHCNDSYSTPATEGMAAEYNLLYFPSMLFNGGNLLLGGSIASYEKQTRFIEQELAKTPPIAILANVDFLVRITIEATFTNTSTAAISNAELFVVLYEDLGADEYHYLVRDILEPQYIANLAAGVTRQLSITSNYSGSTANLHAVVYIKTSDNEILQATLAG